MILTGSQGVLTPSYKLATNKKRARDVLKDTIDKLIQPFAPQQVKKSYSGVKMV
jgi:hypothetical protein